MAGGLPRKVSKYVKLLSMRVLHYPCKFYASYPDEVSRGARGQHKAKGVRLSWQE